MITKNLHITEWTQYKTTSQGKLVGKALGVKTIQYKVYKWEGKWLKVHSKTKFQRYFKMKWLKVVSYTLRDGMWQRKIVEWRVVSEQIDKQQKDDINKQKYATKRQGLSTNHFKGQGWKGNWQETNLRGEVKMCIEWKGEYHLYNDLHGHNFHYTWLMSKSVSTSSPLSTFSTYRVHCLVSSPPMNLKNEKCANHERLFDSHHLGQSL